METLRKLLSVVVILFLLFALLLLLNVISITYLDSSLTDFNPENFYRTVFGIAAGLILLQLIFNYFAGMAAKRERNSLNARITELKATLYDRKITEIRENREARTSGTNSTDAAGPVNQDPIFPPDTLH